LTGSLRGRVDRSLQAPTGVSVSGPSAEYCLPPNGTSGAPEWVAQACTGAGPGESIPCCRFTRAMAVIASQSGPVHLWWMT